MEVKEIKFDQPVDFDFSHLENAIDKCRKEYIEFAAKKYDISIDDMTKIADEISRLACEHLPDNPFELLRQVQEAGGVKTIPMDLSIPNGL